MRDLRRSIVPPARSAGGLSTLLVSGAALALGACLPSEFDRPPSAKPVQISASAFGCAVTEQGTVRCWGSNDNGELGADVSKTTFNRVNEPVEVVGLRGAVAVSTGDDFNCALLDTGEVKCWGFNAAGQLGQAKEVVDSNSLASSQTPLTVVGLPAAKQIALSGSNACALTQTGTVWCWGDGSSGELGDGVDLTSVGVGAHFSTKAIQVAGLTGVLDLAAGYDRVCVVTAAHGVKCWGGGAASTPTDVDGLTSGVARVATGGANSYAGRALCATMTAGGVSCMASSGADDPVLGRGASTTTPATTPAPVMGLTGQVSMLSIGSGMACAVVAGGVKCWGKAQHDLNLGAGETLYYSAVPVAVPSLETGATAVAVGSEIACAIADGRLSCWGCKACSGDGSTDFSGGDPLYKPAHVVGLP